MYNLIKLYKITNDANELVRMLRVWQLIPGEGEYNCPQCNGHLKLIRQLDRSDGFIWFCGNMWQTKPKGKTIRCTKRIELRTGTFFSHSKLSIFQILGFVNLWCEGASMRMFTNQMEIDRKTAVDWASYCREVVFDAFISNITKIGGPGKVVEIDESKFGKRKYHRGHRVEGQWVFGGYERETGRVFMVAVENRGADILIPIIKDWILEGTTIISDYWRSYDCLNTEGYQHLKVNHSIHFKDPESGAHTNAIESSWRAAKSTISTQGRRKSHIPGNLARYMFYKSCNERNVDRMVEFLKLAAGLYNPLLQNQQQNPFVDNEVPAEDLDEDLDD